MEEGSTEENARDWLLDVLRQYSIKRAATKSECQFSHLETWKRVDSSRFRFLYNLVRVAYTRDKDENPAVLYEKWLYDIGIYLRSGTCVDYTLPNLEFSPSMVLQLSSLGQASERDLCRRKQPYKDPKYYVKRIAVSDTMWLSDLFPVGRNGSICPLLMCPFQDSVSYEVSGGQGLAMCISINLERRLQAHFKAAPLSLFGVWEILKVLCTVFVSEILDVRSTLELQFGSVSLRSTVLTSVENNFYNFPQLQKAMDHFKLKFTARDILLDLYNLLRHGQEIDFVVDKLRFELREAINEEVKKILFPPSAVNKAVARINLTDSDLIGGDNSKQEMSAAAFVSSHAVLVTWHLTGRMRY